MNLPNQGHYDKEDYAKEVHPCFVWCKLQRQKKYYFDRKGIYMIEFVVTLPIDTRGVCCMNSDTVLA